MLEAHTERGIESEHGVNRPIRKWAAAMSERAMPSNKQKHANCGGQPGFTMQLVCVSVMVCSISKKESTRKRREKARRKRLTLVIITTTHP
jgi:hypothetical protein